ncbi:PhzF family phenazine biosynthesis protein [Pseudalkalibacillus salsuginis]|uniref:PhzF family phenazine biosynthesis protein n=1 Tax=Pseudalkalibacillus salsuginis TaxID=2910972 RepID=UPI001F2F3282|nr:PhzF family phenazine biosynthesis protein [Pseudalkalibacillus salsuginis]MCF6409869.1 PhzF family phenazine biosynthesis protein [Pseudalkalibacillus salsuginis]
MSVIQYSIVDVFSQGKYTGNQLAVFKLTGYVSDHEMQQIAKEINFSETTFVLPETNENCYDVRIFTPNQEIPFAGHPALGTAFIIRNEIVQEPLDKLNLKFKAGNVTVSFDNEKEILWMEQNTPAFGKILHPGQVAEVLSIDKQHIENRFPIQEVSTGLPVIVVPLKSLDAVKKVKIDKDKYFKLIEALDAKGVMVFSPETYHTENDLNVRDFAEYYGIPEDPATGSSNGCLAYYLVKYRFFESGEINLRVEQGYEIDRPSLLFLNAWGVNGEINVHVGGRVEKIAQGEWFI